MTRSLFLGRGSHPDKMYHCPYVLRDVIRRLASAENTEDPKFHETDDLFELDESAAYDGESDSCESCQ